jgi:aspartate aminotransferase-like enzyme
MPLLPQAQIAMASYGAHHRTADFGGLFTRVLADVKEFIGTKNYVLVLTSSGTGFMEASVSNLTSPAGGIPLRRPRSQPVLRSQVRHHQPYVFEADIRR